MLSILILMEYSIVVDFFLKKNKNFKKKKQTNKLCFDEKRLRLTEGKSGVHAAGSLAGQ